ncbi:transglutaminase domain-containing protein [Bacteroides sp.]|uniref:transglutaminase domain-containing protein n=1 Tax=Bacteroides sp. TaxID=29523 RepID=UPI0025C42269|nr:transglutaminase domain-containing protein [Bacteroides sp.]
MKTLVRLLLVPFFSVLLFSCSESHFLKEEAYRNQVLQDFEQKQQALPDGNLFAILSGDSLSLSEREALMFLYAYMPIGDIADYPGDYYLGNIRLSEQARREMPWGKTITDELFRHFILPVRVNNENLDESREVFYRELKERVKGLSMKDAILEVNHWCHEKVVYRPSDARTSSPLASVKTAYGRCGEESTFTVAALRSVGIPARQVYTPRWAHTDDNHAWVEAWADGKWYFFGACEPEPVLNLGWFNAPASRGMLMHTKVFGRYNGPEEIMLETPNYTEINVIDNYAPTGKAVVMVTDADGQPVTGAKVDFKVYNYAEFYTVATKYTGADGQASLTAGKGDMLVWGSKDGKFGYGKLSFGKDDKLVLALDKKEGEAYAFDLDIVPPAEGANLPEVTPEQRKENDFRLAKEDSIRNAYVATMMTEERAKDALAKFNLSNEDKEKMIKMLVASRGNYKTLLVFMELAAVDKKEGFALALLQQLSAKDWRDVQLIDLMDYLIETPDYQKLGAQASAELVNPRVENEMLTAYRCFFMSAFSQKEVESFVEEPSGLVEWCKKEIKINNELNSQRIPISPVGVWQARVADEKSRDIFFVAMARTFGISAQIDKVTGKVQYVNKEGHTIDVDFAESTPVQAATGLLRATYKPIRSLPDPKYYSHFTLSKFKDGVFQLLNYDEGDADMGAGTTWSNLLKNGTPLDAGYYMLVTGTRMASGAVLSKVTFFTIEPNKTTTIDLVMRESDEQVQVIGNFNSESLYIPVSDDNSAATQSLLQTCGRGYFVVGVLGVGQEPTNHALRDIAALGGEFEKWGRKMVFLFPSEEQYKKFHPTEFQGLPSTITYGIDMNNSIQQQIAKSMNLPNQNILPMFIIADTFNRVVFVSQGYTIGLGEQLMKTIHGL